MTDSLEALRWPVANYVKPPRPCTRPIEYHSIYISQHLSYTEISGCLEITLGYMYILCMMGAAQDSKGPVPRLLILQQPGNASVSATGYCNTEAGWLMSKTGNYMHDRRTPARAPPAYR